MGGVTVPSLVTWACSTLQVDLLYTSTRVSQHLWPVLSLANARAIPVHKFCPTALSLTVVGASMLWVGWFGFNAGSAVAADGPLAWPCSSRRYLLQSLPPPGCLSNGSKNGKPSILGAVTGTIAGLGAITPASGSVGPLGAIVIGLAAGAILLLGCHSAQTKIEL